MNKRLLLLFLLLCLAAGPARAEELPHDDSLPAATPKELEQLSDDRLREQIMHESIAAYNGACSCPYQTRPNGKSCRGHVHVLKAHPPLCYPRQVTAQMLADWRRAHQ